MATELFIAFGLWWRATRYAAVWIAVCFHVAIQVSASVEVFSYLGIAALVIWAVPSTRDRVLVVDPVSASHRRLARGVRCTRLAGPLPRRARCAWIGGAGHRSRRHAHRGWAGSCPRVEQVAPDGVVRAAGAAAAVGSPGTHAQRPVDGDRRRAASGRRRGPGRRVAGAALGSVVAAVVVFGALAPPERCPEVTEAALMASDRGRRLVHPQPGGRRHVAVPVRARHGQRRAGLQRRAALGRGVGPLHGGVGVDPGSARDRPTGGWRGRSTGSLERDDWSAVTDEGQTSAGTTALLVAGLAERRDADE